MDLLTGLPRRGPRPPSEKHGVGSPVKTIPLLLPGSCGDPDLWAVARVEKTLSRGDRAAGLGGPSLSSLLLCTQERGSRFVQPDGCFCQTVSVAPSKQTPFPSWSSFMGPVPPAGCQDGGSPPRCTDTGAGPLPTPDSEARAWSVPQGFLALVLVPGDAAGLWPHLEPVTKAFK